MFNQSASATQADPTDPNQQQLLRLNIDFLHLLCRMNAASTGAALPQLGLPAAQFSALTQCVPAGLARMASCGFSLFSLSLHRADLWQQALTRSQAMPQADHYAAQHAGNPDSGLDLIGAGFMECALFFAWHLAQLQPRQARLLLGMSEDCMAIIKQLHLWQCRHIAQTQLRLLSPRWRHHPYFWTDLLNYGNSGEAQHFKFAQLLGTQLMAQELEPSAVLRLSTTD